MVTTTQVRWSVFLLGPAGCGKTSIWKTLLRAQNNYGEKTIYKPVNPKAVTRNELYGALHPTTREWKEGLISVTFRDMANNQVSICGSKIINPCIPCLAAPHYHTTTLPHYHEPCVV
jgi:GTPase SAR1 family protein